MTDDAEPILRTVGLTREFGALVAVDGIDLTVERGEIRGLIGPNGAGKTTCFNLLSGVLAPTAGDVWLDGERITGLPPHARARRGLAQSMQIESVFGSLTALENVLGAIGAGAGRPNPFERYDADPDRRDRAAELLGRVGLEDHAGTTVAELSHGDKKLLDIALGLATDPELLLLDEPTAGLSAEETADIAELIEALRGDVSMVLIEHDVDMVLQLVDTITVLHEGLVLAEGPPETIAANETVQRVYLGRD